MIRNIEQQFYQNLSDTIVESVKLFSMTEDELKQRVKVKWASLVDKDCTPETPLILYTAHYGNWEWVPAIQFFYDKRIKSAEIYKPLRDGAMDKVIARMRTKLGSILIPQNLAFREIMKMKKEGERFIVGFVADHRQNSEYSELHLDFLNHSTPVALGPEKMGAHIGAKYLYLHIEKPRRGHYVFEFREMIPCSDGKSYPYTRQYFKMLEQDIRENPALWLWSHRRWLYK